MKIYTKEQIINEQAQWPENDLSKQKDFGKYEFCLVASDGQSIGTNDLDEFDKFFESKGMFYVDGPDRYTQSSSLKEAVYAAIESPWAYGEVRYVRGTPQGGLFSLDGCPVIFEAEKK